MQRASPTLNGSHFVMVPAQMAGTLRPGLPLLAAILWLSLLPFLEKSKTAGSPVCERLRENNIVSQYGQCKPR